MKRANTSNSQPSAKKTITPNYNVKFDVPLNTPKCIKLNSKGDVIFTDSVNGRVCRISNGKLEIVAGRRDGSRQSLLATDIHLDTPDTLHIDENDDIYVSTRKAIYKIHTNGFVSKIHTNGQFKNIQGMTYTNGEFIVSDVLDHKIKKIDKQGIVTVLAGSGTPGDDQGEFSNATSVNFKRPGCVVKTKDGKIVFSTEGRIFQLDPTHNILTTLATYDTKIRRLLSVDSKGDLFLFRNPKVCTGLIEPLSVPFMAVATPTGEYISLDHITHNLFKIDKNNKTTVIVGTGEKGIASLPFVSYPFNNQKLKKYNRDILFDSTVFGFLPLITVLSPQFTEKVLNRDVLPQVDAKVVQQLIDSLIYSKTLQKNDNPIVALSVLGLFQGGEFLASKKLLTGQVVTSITLNNVHIELQKLDDLRQKFPSNYIIEKVFNYCIEFAASLLKSSDQILSHEIIKKHILQIAAKVQLSEPSPIQIDEEETQIEFPLKKLFNDRATSDITIKVGSKTYACHKTILASKSSYFEGLFNSGASYQDLQNNEHTMDTDEFDEEIISVIIKFCYGIFEIDLKSTMIIPLLKYTLLHEINDLVNYCVSIFTVTKESFFPVIEQLRPIIDTDNQYISAIVEKIINFGFEHRRSIFTSEQQIADLPDKIRNAYILKLFIA